MPRKGMLKKQEAGTKKCPSCETGTVYTGEMAKHSPAIDGVRVCEDCYVHHLVNRYHNKE